MTKNNLRFVEGEEKNVEERKKALRAYMKERRADNENRDGKELLLIDNVLRVLEYYEGAGMQRTAFCYLSFSSEAPTDRLIETLRERGYTLFAPRVEDKRMQAVAIGEDFTLSKLGIREPVGEEYAEDIGVAIVPLLAVDKQGNRLGYGGGFYDRYLSTHEKTARIGYCFDFQVVKEVPATFSDSKLDCIVTDKRIFSHLRK